jgi:L-ascorbate metabolism protein UlaG (beta-lactamase superfamily)
MKTLTAILIIIFSSTAFSQIKFKWLGITAMTISDGKTTLFFDPAITRLGPLDFLPFKKVQSDHTEVDYWLNRCGVKSVQATIVNHAHTDHVIDAPYVTKKFQTKLFGSTSVLNVGRGHGLSHQELQEIKDGGVFKIGDFTITSYNTPHPPHAGGIMLMDGHIEKPLPPQSKAWDYKVGDTFSFYISHPKGNLIYQAVADIPALSPLHKLKADVALISIANRTSTEKILTETVKPSKASMVVPLHIDNFLYPMNKTGEIDLWWGLKLEEFTQKITAGGIKVLTPKYCDEVTLIN